MFDFSYISGLYKRFRSSYHIKRIETDSAYKERMHAELKAKFLHERQKEDATIAFFKKVNLSNFKISLLDNSNILIKNFEKPEILISSTSVFREEPFYTVINNSDTLFLSKPQKAIALGQMEASRLRDTWENAQEILIVREDIKNREDYIKKQKFIESRKNLEKLEAIIKEKEQAVIEARLEQERIEKNIKEQEKEAAIESCLRQERIEANIKEQQSIEAFIEQEKEKIKQERIDYCIKEKVLWPNKTNFEILDPLILNEYLNTVIDRKFKEQYTLSNYFLHKTIYDTRSLIGIIFTKYFCGVFHTKNSSLQKYYDIYGVNKEMQELINALDLYIRRKNLAFSSITEFNKFLSIIQEKSYYIDYEKFFKILKKINKKILNVNYTRNKGDLLCEFYNAQELLVSLEYSKVELREPLLKDLIEHLSRIEKLQLSIKCDFMVRKDFMEPDFVKLETFSNFFSLHKIFKSARINYTTILALKRGDLVAQNTIIRDTMAQGCKDLLIMTDSFPKKEGLLLYKSKEIANICELFGKWWW